MPNLNGTGPNGRGPMTGRGVGPCGNGAGNGAGNGGGYGLGYGRGYGRGRFISPQNELSALDREKTNLEEELEILKKEISALRDQQK